MNSDQERGLADEQLEREELGGVDRNRALAEMDPVGGGLLTMDEIVEAVRDARAEGPAGLDL